MIINMNHCEYVDVLKQSSKSSNKLANKARVLFAKKKKTRWTEYGWSDRLASWIWGVYPQQSLYLSRHVHCII